MRSGAIAWAMVAGLAGLSLAAASGCRAWRPPDYEQRRLVVELADALREEALKLPDAGPRERLVTGLVQMRELMLDESVVKADQETSEGPRLPQPEGGAKPAPPWAVMFAPAALVIGFFTQSKDLGGQGGDDGLEVRLQPLDQFGDPTKAVGSYRIEVFEYRLRTGEKRGNRMGHWFVSVLDEASQRKYYDPVDRSYVFPLLWGGAVPPGMVLIVQATYYPPGGFQEKLFAQRVIKTGSE